MKNKVLVVSIVVGLSIVVVTVVTLFAIGKLVWVGQSSQPTVSRIVCGDDTVATFNDAMYFVGRNGSSTYSIDEDGVKKLKADILASPGYDADPTCQTLLYLTAIYFDDYEAAKTAYLAVDRLHKKNLYADNNIRGNQPLFMYEDSMYALSPEGKKPGGVGSAGGE